MQKKRAARVELYYWPGIPGRGEFVRLLLEDGAVPYVDVARQRNGGGMQKMLRYLQGGRELALPFAPPFVKVDGAIVSQTANVLTFLAARFRLIGADPLLRAEASQVQLTLADFVGEIHDTHHPIAGGLYYDDQKTAAKQRARLFVKERLPKYLEWLEKLLARNRRSAGRWLVGATCTYADLSTFQIVEGLRYAFPNAMQQMEARVPRVMALHARVAMRPRIAAYRASKRCQPFNQLGIFRHYPELDAAPPRPSRRRSGGQ